MTRQQARRTARKVAKKMIMNQRRHDAAATLAAVRATRQFGAWQCPKKHPGKLLSSRRRFKKPHHTPNWRVHELGAVDCIERFGAALPHGLEATFHRTKGLRVVRVAA